MKLRIALVGACPFPVPQGSQVFIRDNALALQDRGHEVHLVVYGYGEGRDASGLTIHRCRRIPGEGKTAAGPSMAKPFQDLAMVLKLRQVVERHRIDAVIANAGVSIATPFHKEETASFRSVFDPSFFGTLDVAMAAWPHLRAQKYGRLVLTASSAGYFGVHGLAAYSASKGAVIGLMRALAIEGKSAGVRVNAILPYAYSQMTAAHMDETMKAALDPAHVAPLVTWLASEACDVTAEVLAVGGGRLARAAAVETPSIPLEPSNLSGSIVTLRGEPMREFPDATAAFLDFLRGKE